MERCRISPPLVVGGVITNLPMGMSTDERPVTSETVMPAVMEGGAEDRLRMRSSINRRVEGEL